MSQLPPASAPHSSTAASSICWTFCAHFAWYCPKWHKSYLYGVFHGAHSVPHRDLKKHVETRKGTMFNKYLRLPSTDGFRVPVWSLFICFQHWTPCQKGIKCCCSFSSMSCHTLTLVLECRYHKLFMFSSIIWNRLNFSFYSFKFEQFVILLLGREHGDFSFVMTFKINKSHQIIKNSKIEFFKLIFN